MKSLLYILTLLVLVSCGSQTVSDSSSKENSVISENLSSNVSDKMIRLDSTVIEGKKLNKKNIDHEAGNLNSLFMKKLKDLQELQGLLFESSLDPEMKAYVEKALLKIHDDKRLFSEANRIVGYEIEEPLELDSTSYNGAFTIQTKNEQLAYKVTVEVNPASETKFNLQSRD